MAACPLDALQMPPADFWICRRLGISREEYQVGQRWFDQPALWQEGKVVIQYQPKNNSAGVP